MNCDKVGKLILELRKEKNMTQKQLADAMNISDKTISKWERGQGCPDVSLLNELSKILEVNVEKILLGDLNPNQVDAGNIKKIKFYVCQSCNNIITNTGNAEISCCGRKLEALKAKKEDENHKANVKEIDGATNITFDHEMKKSHYISFAAHVSFDRVLMVKLYPEQEAELNIPRMRKGKLYFYCNEHGLFVK